MTTTRIGTSGWTYPAWRGRFYPEGLARTKELGYLSTQLNALELNGTFYRLQRPSTYAKWATQVDDGFTFAVKGWKQVTHIRKLRDAATDVAQFFGSGVLELGATLGTILWQLPPSLRFDADVAGEFLAGLPQTVGEAREIAARVSEAAAAAAGSVAQPALLPELETTTPAVPAETPLRYAIEPRNASWGEPDALALLREHNAAMVISDTAGKFPRFDDVTTDFVYARLHGSPRLYFSRYSEEFLQEWADKITAWRAQGVGMNVFFDNTGAGHAPENALRLAELVSA